MRRVFWAAFLTAALVFTSLEMHHLLATSYALTWSVGDGYGFTVRTHYYYEANPLIQESIDIHEAVHLKDATWRFWEKASHERAAYRVQLQAGLVKLRELRLAGKTGADYFEFKKFLNDILPETF